MSFRRILAIMRKDISSGLGRTFFVMALVVPVVMTLIINLVFGRFFTEKPTLAVVDEGHSRIVEKIEDLDTVIIGEAKDEKDLREKVKNGDLDGGVVLPKYFDEDLDKHKLPEVEIYIGGESLASNRMVLASSLAELLRKEVGQKLPIEIIETPLGKAVDIPIRVKVIPLLILYAIFIGGATLPTVLLVDEVTKKTVSAVTITPASLGELIWAKAIVGFLTSFAMGIAILVMNQIFVGNVWLLIIFMVLGAIFAVEMGLIMGSISKDMTIAWTYVKLLGMFAFMPALLAFFPQVPDWVSQIFPTYYLINPIIGITQHAAQFADVWLDALILLLFDIFFIVFVFLGSKRMAART